MTTHDKIEGPKTTGMRSQRTGTTLPPTRCRTTCHTRITFGLSHTTYDTTPRKLRKFRSAACPIGIDVETNDQVPPICERTQQETDELGQPDQRKRLQPRQDEARRLAELPIQRTQRIRRIHRITGGTRWKRYNSPILTRTKIPRTHRMITPARRYGVVQAQTRRSDDSTTFTITKPQRRDEGDGNTIQLHGPNEDEATMNSPNANATTNMT